MYKSNEEIGRAPQTCTTSCNHGDAVRPLLRCDGGVNARQRLRRIDDTTARRAPKSPACTSTPALRRVKRSSTAMTRRSCSRRRTRLRGQRREHLHRQEGRDLHADASQNILEGCMRQDADDAGRGARFGLTVVNARSTAASCSPRYSPSISGSAAGLQFVRRESITASSATARRARSQRTGRSFYDRSCAVWAGYYRWLRRNVRQPEKPPRFKRSSPGIRAGARF